MCTANISCLTFFIERFINYWNLNLLLHCILTCSKFPERVQLVSLALLTIRVRSKMLVSKSTRRLHYTTSKSVVTWFVCLCISVEFQFTGRSNFSFLLSKPSEAFQNVKNRLEIHASSELHHIEISNHLVCLPLYFSSDPSLRALQFFILAF